MATNNSINSRELIKTNNLSDLTNTTTARTNLGSGAVGGNTSFATTFIAYDGGGDFYQFANGGAPGGDGMVIIKYYQDDYFSPTGAHYYRSGPTFY